MSKVTDKNYFQHFYGARNELAMLRLRQKHGQAGYGAYWEIIEKLFENGGEMNLKDIPLFAYELHIDDDGAKVLESVIKDFGLFELNEKTGDFTAQTVMEQLQFRAEKSEKAKQKAAARWGKKDNDKTEEEQPLVDTKDVSEKLIQFKTRFPQVAIDLNGDALKRKMAQIDIDKLTEAVEESTELKGITSLIALCDKYDRAIKGYYKDKTVTLSKTPLNATTFPL